jgi:hypothetical protein
VAATTLVQRLAGDDVMTRVFGLSEAVQTASETLGVLLVPVLVAALGPRDAVVAAGVALVVVSVLAAPVFLRAERVDPAFLRDLRILRAASLFGPLSGPVLERLTAGAVRVSVPPGEVIVREGDVGDRFYVLATGGAEVSVAGRVVRQLGPGDVFGEIALLRDIPRTATVRASGPTDVLAIERAPFLEALTGQPRSRQLAGDVAAARLAADRSPGGVAPEGESGS